LIKRRGRSEVISKKSEREAQGALEKQVQKRGKLANPLGRGMCWDSTSRTAGVVKKVIEATGYLGRSLENVCD